MSVALSKVRGRVRARLRDLDAREGSYTGPEIDMCIAESWILLGSQLPAPVVATSSAFTISDGSETFTLPVTVTSSGYGTGTTEYAGDVRIQLATSGQYLRKVTQTELDLLRGGAAPASIPQALPQFFALYQDGSQIIRGRCWPAAHPAQVCNLWATISPEDLRDYVGTGGAEGTDTATIQTTRAAAQALVAYTAGELLGRLTAERANQRGLDKSTAQVWKSEALDLLYAEEAHQHSIKSTGRIMRFVP